MVALARMTVANLVHHRTSRDVHTKEYSVANHPDVREQEEHVSKLSAALVKASPSRSNFNFNHCRGQNPIPEPISFSCSSVITWFSPF